MSQHGYSPPCKMDTTGATHEGEVTIDLLIETLTGTAFEMTVSPLDTIATIKSKIHRIEGIPVSAQHLLYNLHELEDNARLLDCSIKNGATLKLVTSMRGGPISNRRFMPSPEERAWMDLVDANRCDNILEHLPSGQLTVFVFCEGDQLNLFRVVENVDESYSPATDSVASSSVRNALSADEPEVAAQRLHENTVTMGKVQDLQRRLSKGTRRRKLVDSGKFSMTESSNSESSSQTTVMESSKAEFSSQGLKGESACHKSKDEPLNLASHLTSQPTLQMSSISKSTLPSIPSKQCAVNSSASSSYLPNPNRNLAGILQRRLKKHLSLPPLEVSGCVSPPTTSEQFIPPSSFCGSVKTNSAQASQTISAQRQSQSPSPNLLTVRTICPPLCAPSLPRRPYLLRPLLNQRQRPPVLQELKHSFSPLASSIQNDADSTDQPLQSASICLPMCQTQPKLEPIALPNDKKRMHLTLQSSPYPHCYLSCKVNGGSQYDSHQDDGTRHSCLDTEDGRIPGSTRWLCSQPHLFQRNVAWVSFHSELSENQQLSTVTSYYCLLPPCRPSASPKERLITHLTASLTRSFSVRFPCVFPVHLAMYLSYRLTERLPDALPTTASDDSSLSRLADLLSDRICDCIGDCLSNKPPEDMFGTALQALLYVRSHGAHGNRGPISYSGNEMALSRFVSVGRSILQNNNKVEGDLPSSFENGALHCPDVADCGVPEHLPFTEAAQCLPPSSLLSSQLEPLSLRLSDSSIFQRRSTSEISNSSSQCPCPGSTSTTRISSRLSSILLNTIHSGPHSVEYVQHVIESSVQHISQPDLQHRLQGEQRQIQILNRADEVTAPLAVFPHYQEPTERILFGPNLQSLGSNVPEQKFPARDLRIEHGISAKHQPANEIKGVTNINYYGVKSSNLKLSSLPEICNDNEDNSSQEESKIPKKPHRRCCQCRKKLTISNKYLCRCQKLFCSIHRYSESHDCNYNYKEEGRKLLQQENPQVMAEKIIKM